MDFISDSSLNKGESKKRNHSAIKVIVKILNCIIIAGFIIDLKVKKPKI